MNMNVVIKNHRRTAIILSNPSFKLLPGENDVPSEVWDSNKKSRSVEMWLEAGYLVDCTDLTKARPLAVDTNITSVPDMLRNIQKCNRVELLAEWGSVDDRTEVRKAIMSRIDDLKLDKEKSIPKVVVDDPTEKPKKKRGRPKSARRKKE